MLAIRAKERIMRDWRVGEDVAYAAFLRIRRSV